MAKTDETSGAAEAPVAAETNASEATIAGRFAVDFSLPLPQFDTVGAVAYAAKDVGDPRRQVYALAQRFGVPRRDHVLVKLVGRNVPGIASPRGEGLALVTDRDGQGMRQVTIVERPVGGRLVETLAKFPAISEKIIRELLAPQLAATLESLMALGITHRSISPRSLYFRDSTRAEIMLAECFSAPPAYHQSPAYEPIERALADPAGRGPGDLACDMYALGVTLMSLFLGRDVGKLGEESDAAYRQLEMRMRAGSYWALGGTNELGGAIGDLLRGLMEDNPTKRWEPEDVKRWTDGLVGRKAVSDPGWVLTRPAIFREKSFKDRRNLALAFFEAPRDAISFARSERFRHWLENALAEGPTTDWVDRALDARTFGVDGDLIGLDEQLAIARLMAIFFPEGPICFGSLRFSADGFATLIAMAYADEQKERLDLMRELFLRGRLTGLLDVIGNRAPALKPALSRLSGIIPFASSPVLGLGLERCLYEFNKVLPCQSPKLRASYVDSLDKLALALEEAAGRGGGAIVIDRHIAAFLISHSAAFEGAVARLANFAAKPDVSAVETVRILGLLQQKHYPQPLKNLAKSLLPVLKKPLEQLKSTTRRRQALAALSRLTGDGNLMRLVTELDLKGIRERDEREFRAARLHYAAILAEQRRLETPVTAEDGRVKATGYQFTAYAAYCLALVVTVVSVLRAAL